MSLRERIRCVEKWRLIVSCLHFWLFMSICISDVISNVQLHYRELLNFLTSVTELVAWLFEKNCMSEPQRQKFMTLHTQYEAAEKLVNFLLIQQSEDVYNIFLVGLLQTKQHHVYSLLTING